MIDRYENSDIAKIWAQASKGNHWQEVELAVVAARERLGEITEGTALEMRRFLQDHPVDVVVWNDLDTGSGKLKHDFNAFLAERKRFLPPYLHAFWHAGTTSYDTEEPAFTRMLSSSVIIVGMMADSAETALKNLARRYRYTPMYSRTHGQGAKVQTFGKRCLSWLAQLRLVRAEFARTSEVLKFSKLSGAVGNYGKTLTPELEREALGILGLQPYYGATQIMPRILYVPLATSLCLIVDVLNQIALDIRLMARSGMPLVQEPFDPKQMGSSAMPHKKNTITTENIAGMARLARGYLAAIHDNVETWEERAIEQSSVERVAWPDLFHVVCNALKGTTRVLSGLRVYPDKMMQELAESHGCFASDEAKEALVELGTPVGLMREDVYRIIQLAAFNVHKPSVEAAEIRLTPPTEIPARVLPYHRSDYDSIERVICDGRLRVSPELAPDAQQVQEWNEKLRQIFDVEENFVQWEVCFHPDKLLANEAVLYREILGE